MRHLDLFSGIGGFALAAERVWPGIEHTFVEFDPFCQAVLKKHWPEAEIYGDIREFVKNSNGLRDSKRKQEEQKYIGNERNARAGNEERVHILTGGFPCQPFSHAGRRRGTEDDRYLWPPMLECISLFRPEWVIAENVRGLVTWNNGLVLETVCADLEKEGYEVQPLIIPAVAVGAPHRRDRVWVIAHTKDADDRGNTRELSQANEQQTQERQEEWPSESRGANKLNAPDTESTRQRTEQALPRKREKFSRHATATSWTENWPEVAARLCTLDDGLPDGLVRPRGWRNAALKAAGNAIVPQVAEEIMRAINGKE